MMALQAGKPGGMSLKFSSSPGPTSIVLFQTTPPLSDDDVRARLAAFGAVAWCTTVAPGCSLVHLGQPSAAAAAVAALNGVTAPDGTALSVQLYAIDPLPHAVEESSPRVGRQDSISAGVPPTLDMAGQVKGTEQQQQQQQQPGPRSAFAFDARSPFALAASGGVAGWPPQQAVPEGGGDLAPVDSEVGSTIEAAAGAGGGSALWHMWRAKSIGTRARTDLASFAAPDGGAAAAAAPGPAVNGATHNLSGLEELLGAAPPGTIKQGSFDFGATLAAGNGGGLALGEDGWVMQQARAAPGPAGRPPLPRAFRMFGPNGAPLRTSSGGGGSSSAVAQILAQQAASGAMWGAAPALQAAQDCLGTDFSLEQLQLLAGAGDGGAADALHGGYSGSGGPAMFSALNAGAPAYHQGVDTQQLQPGRGLGAAAATYQQPTMQHHHQRLQTRGAPQPRPHQHMAYAPPPPPPAAHRHTGSGGGGSGAFVSQVLGALFADGGAAPPNPLLTEFRALLAATAAGPGGAAAISPAAFVTLLQDAAAAALEGAGSRRRNGCGSHADYVLPTAADGEVAGGTEGLLLPDNLRLAPVNAPRGGGGSACGGPENGTPSSAGGGLQTLSPLSVASTPGGGPLTALHPPPPPPPPPGSPLTPQRTAELAAARAALLRLMCAAHAMVGTAQFARLCVAVGPVCELYDTMHDCPVVVKRRRCRDMEVMRDQVMRDPEFVKALQLAAALRAHIHGLSRRVLLGAGHYDGLPIDLFLGGLSSELSAVLKEAGPPDAAAAAAAAAGGGGGALAAAAATLAALPWGAPPPHVRALPQSVLDFFSIALPLPQLAILVFAEFVPVDPSPHAATAAAATGSPAAAPRSPGGRWPQQGAANGAAARGPSTRASAPGDSPRRTVSGIGGGGGAPSRFSSPGGGSNVAAAPLPTGPVSFAAAAAAAAAAVKAVASDLGGLAGQQQASGPRAPTRAGRMSG